MLVPVLGRVDTGTGCEVDSESDSGVGAVASTVEEVLSSEDNMT